MTSVYSEYTKLSSYLKGQQFGPKSDVPVPDMGYPILPLQQVNYGFNTLTHDSDNVGYYNIESGYGQPKQCTSFAIGQCPSNNLIQPYGPSTTTTRSGRVVEGFQLESASSPTIIMFVQDNCKYCKDVLKDLPLQKTFPGMSILNLKDGNNMKTFVSYGGQGVPFFVSPVSKKSFTGKPKSIENLKMALQLGSEKPATDIIRDLDIKILLSKRCGYCTRLKNMLEQSGAINKVTLMYDNDPNVPQVFGSFKVSGVPFIFSAKTKKTISGAPATMQQLIQGLQ
jgi:glutaredoxin